MFMLIINVQHGVTWYYNDIFQLLGAYLGVVPEKIRKRQKFTNLNATRKVNYVSK